MKPLLAVASTLLLSSVASAAGPKLSVLIVDGVNNHDWVTATRNIRTILEGNGRFNVDVCTYPQRAEFRGYDVVANNFNGGQTAAGVRWPREMAYGPETGSA